MAFVSGKLGLVRINSQVYKFDTYELDVDGDLPDVTHFGLNGELLLASITSNEVTLSGPDDIGGMPLTQGTEYTVFLSHDGVIGYTMTMRCKSWNLKNQAKDTGRLKAVMRASNGTGFVGATV